MTDAASPRQLEAPAAVRWIVGRLEEAGYETWAVGGAVRDAVLGHPSGDWDLATRARPEDVRRIFPRTVPIGMEHGTVGVLARDGTLYEVTTFRRDVETFGRHAVVAFAETLEEDLERRDFTVNALAWHPLREVLFDPHGGAADLARRLLRTVGAPAARFAEDYLRVLRALRFAGRYGLEISPETWRALKAATAHLAVLSPERVREELWKVLANDPTPGRALELYRRSGVLAASLPELARVAGDGPEGSPEWSRTLAAVGAVRPHRVLLRLAVLLGEVGAPTLAPEDPPLPVGSGPAATEARRRGMVRAAAVLTRLRHSNAQVSRVAGLVASGPSLPADDAAGTEIRRWLARVEPWRVPDLIRWAAADARAHPREVGARGSVVASFRRIRSELRAGHPLSVGDLALDGRDLIRLGLRPGPRFGEILETLLDEVLRDPSANRKELLEGRALALAQETGSDRG